MKVIKVMISVPENEFNAIRQYDVEPVSPYIKYIRDGVVLPDKIVAKLIGDTETKERN